MPSTNISAMAGTTTIRSPSVRSGSFDHFSFSGPLKTRCRIVRMKIAVTSRPMADSAVGPRHQREHALEDQELADEPVQARQPERREQGDAHQPAEDRRDLAQAAEVVQPAQAAAPLLEQADEPEQRRGRQAVVEHLQEHAVERGGLFGGRRRRRAPVTFATAKMPSRQ